MDTTTPSNQLDRFILPGSVQIDQNHFMFQQQQHQPILCQNIMNDTDDTNTHDNITKVNTVDPLSSSISTGGHYPRHPSSADHEIVPRIDNMKKRQDNDDDDGVIDQDDDGQQQPEVYKTTCCSDCCHGMSTCLGRCFNPKCCRTFCIEFIKLAIETGKVFLQEQKAKKAARRENRKKGGINSHNNYNGSTGTTSVIIPDNDINHHHNNADDMVRVL